MSEKIDNVGTVEIVEDIIELSLYKGNSIVHVSTEEVDSVNSILWYLIIFLGVVLPMKLTIWIIRDLLLSIDINLGISQTQYYILVCLFIADPRWLLFFES